MYGVLQSSRETGEMEVLFKERRAKEEGGSRMFCGW